MFSFSVATINVRGRHDRWRRRRELLVAQIVDRAPDLISLQELSLPIRQGHWLRSQINFRLSGSGNAPYRLIQRRRRHPLRGYYEGVGILSKLPVVAHDYVNLGYQGRVAVRANVELPNGQLLDFVAVHLHPSPVDQEARQDQVMLLTGWLNERNPVPAQIIAGDFNETPGRLAIRQVKQTYRSAYAEDHGREPLATFPTALVQRADDWSGCLDYIFLSKAVGPVRACSLWCHRAAPDDDTLYPSDHVGLVAELALTPPGQRPPSAAAARAWR